MQQFRPGGFRVLPEVVKNLLIINGLFFLATLALPSFGIDLVEKFGLYQIASDKFQPFQLITHMFMHGGFGHIFFNMFMLWMFGSALENVWGPKRFLIFYLVTGLGAAALHLLVGGIQIHRLESEIAASGVDIGLLKQEIFEKLHNLYDVRVSLGYTINNLAFKFGADPDLLASLIPKYFIPTVGASGAVYGLLLGFGMLFPNSLIYIYFLFPIKAKYLVIFMGVIELYTGMANNPGDNVAHYAHLGGMLFGFIMIKFWNKTRNDFY